ncbi:MAG: hypothetical protein DYH02_11785 [Candidatus Omnitrophica bacterium COP1]|nr:hypothetical protein [Candidatus Omnitrophica bacterium COP1]
MKCHIFAGILALCLLITFPSDALTIYSTGFENSEGFPVGSLPITGLNGWIEEVGNGLSAIVTSQKHTGTQSLRVAANSTVKKDIVSAGSLIYLDGWYNPPSSSVFPDLDGYPASSAVFMFHTTSGLIGLDGDGAGNGAWQESHILASLGFNRITLLLDYSNKIWSLYLNEQMIFQNMGFKNNSVSQLNGIRIDSAQNQGGYLDTFQVLDEPPDFLLQDPTPTITETLLPTPTVTQTPVPSPTLTPTGVPASEVLEWKLFR